MSTLTTVYILESRDTSFAGAPWTESACGDTGPGLTRFTSREEAAEALRGLVAVGDGWTEENTRVRSVEVAS